MLEAWLLTGLPLTVVAERCSAGEELVELFESLFYNVRDRLAAKDWLLLRAVGIGPQRDGTPDASWLWRWTGCMAGPVALEAMLKAVPQEWLRGGLADLPLMGPDVELEVGWPRLMALAMICRPTISEINSFCTLPKLCVSASEFGRLSLTLVTNSARFMNALMAACEPQTTGNTDSSCTDRPARRELTQLSAAA